TFLPVLTLSLPSVLGLYFWLDFIRASVSEQKTIVDKHNNLRRGVQPTASNMLKMNRGATSGKTRGGGCLFVNNSWSSGCGENLYMASYKSSWSNVIQAVFIGHYTQVVWYRSNQISCAMAHCPNSNYKYFYVCHNCSP
uniref:SCP domain-containing protein n=1 Tax=Salmo trutta TaxID=8032 RepID=A0A674EQP7_SALTR